MGELSLSTWELAAVEASRADLFHRHSPLSLLHASTIHLRTFQWLSQIQHPIIESVHGGTRSAKDFVDQVEQARQSGDKEAIAKCEQKQKQELEALAEHVQEHHLRR